MAAPAHHRPPTISIGGATYDLFVRTDNQFLASGQDGKTLNLPIGAKIRVLDVIETCGGGASNTAVGLARLGCDAAFTGVVGNDQWGEKLLGNLLHEHVDTRWATVVEGETSSFSIILSVSSGERIILYDPGTNAHLHTFTFDREEMARRDWIYLNHLQEDSIVIQDDLFDVLARKGEHTIGLTWNPGGFQVEAGIDSDENKNLLAHTSILLVNKEEALAFTRRRNVDDALNCLLRGGAKNVFVTDGGDGATAGDAKTVYHCPSMAASSVIDTTGAGDAFGVGVTWAALRGLDLPTMLRAGTINATSVLGVIGAQPGLLTDIEMQQRLQSAPLDVRVVRSRS